jgi:acyl-CoA dehydrogenase
MCKVGRVVTGKLMRPDSAGAASGSTANHALRLPSADGRRPTFRQHGRRLDGFIAVMQNLRCERVTIGVTALAITESAFEDVLACCKERQAFGRPTGKFQHNRLLLGRDGH